MIDTLYLDGSIALAVVQSQDSHIIKCIGEWRLVVIGKHTRVADVEVGEDKLTFIDVGQGGTYGNLNDTHITAKHQRLAVRSYARLDVEAHALQALVIGPRGNASRVLVETYDAIVRTDVERLVIGTNDALHTIIGK